MKNRGILHRTNGSYESYCMLDRAVLFLIDTTFYYCGFVGTGAIHVYRKGKPDKDYKCAVLSHPHYDEASLLGMMFCAYNICRDCEREIRKRSRSENF